MIVQADARHIPLADETVQCVVTSPPYWGLRDYGLAGTGIGLERTLEEYITNLVAVFREVRRVLRPDGTVWLNLGDCYHSDDRGGYRNDSHRWENCPIQNKAKGSHLESVSPNRLPQSGLKDKDLVMMPARVALALQADGWWLRSEIIWHKPNPMPESVEDRPTRSHEYIFLLTKSADYYYDSEAIREPSITGDVRRPYTSNGAWQLDGRPVEQRHGGQPRDTDASSRNKRSVWTINSEPTPEAHFATYPQALVMPCILAGTSAKGCCAKCGAPWVRVLGESRQVEGRGSGNGFRRDARLTYRDADGARGDDTPWVPKARGTLGWKPSCNCNAGIKPCLVLDPFLGSGTTGVVVERLGRRWVGLDLSPEYIEIARRRTAQRGLFTMEGRM